MKNLILNIACCLMGLAGFCQAPQADTGMLTKEAKAIEKHWTDWKKDLYEVGFKLNKDSLEVSTEAKKVMQDSTYRKLLFPEIYTWEKALELMNQVEMKKAFWYLIKLYSKDTANKKLVIQSLVPFDKALEMDKVLISTFYTYAFLDPEICTFKNNRILITHPNVLEKEFSQVKELVGYIQSYRKQASRK